MITTTALWATLYYNFPAGTVFIPVKESERGTVYAYGQPDKTHGQLFCEVGQVPGQPFWGPLVSSVEGRGVLTRVIREALAHAGP